MGIIYGERGEILRSFEDKYGDSEINSRIFAAQMTEDKDVQNIDQYQFAGFESRPPDGSKTIVIKIGENNRVSVAERDGVLNVLAVGETIIYSSDGGAVVAKSHYKNNGTLDIETTADLNITVAGSTTIDSKGDISITAPNINIDGALNVTGIISGDADIIADAQVTAISALQHPHIGDLGYNTGAPVPVGGGVAPPSSPPSATGGDLDMNGNNIINVGTVDGKSVSTHTHSGVTSGTESSGPPN